MQISVCKYSNYGIYCACRLQRIQVVAKWSCIAKGDSPQHFVSAGAICNRVTCSALPADRKAQPLADPRAFENDALTRMGLWHPLVESRYRTSYLNHTFSGGYAAGYYSYLWAEVFDADTVAWYEANGGLTRDNGDAFRKNILAIGGSAPVSEGFKKLTGREADIQPLLVRRGLASAS